MVEHGDVLKVNELIRSVPFVYRITDFMLRRIYYLFPEHVGSKTAVQIRSHAQKFFSKVYHFISVPILYH